MQKKSRFAKNWNPHWIETEALIQMFLLERYGKVTGPYSYRKPTKKMGIYFDPIKAKSTDIHIMSTLMHLMIGKHQSKLRIVYTPLQSPSLSLHFQTQQLFSNCMKSNRPPQKSHQIEEKSSDDGDCSCELLDTSLSNIGDSDCSCSQCLQANLQAFNQLKEQEEQREKEDETMIRRGGSTRAASNKQTRGVSRNTANQNKSTTKIAGFRSIDKMRDTRPRTALQKEQNYASQDYENGESVSPKFSRQCINDYMKITQFRARSYLQQRNNLKKTEQQKRRQLKNLIKENLQALKYTAKNLITQKQKSQDDQNDQQRYKWNHQPYHCKSRVQCRRLKIYQPNLEEKKQQIQKIQERIKRYKETTKQKPYECPDKCPKHHMRTSKKTLIEIQKFIQKKAKEYKQAQKKTKIQKQEKQKIKQAKLRAIDLKCKQKVSRSKKYDPQQERTSFHNSIDHFSTFSQLRIHNKERMEEKKQRRKVKQALKDGKQLQQAIYEDLEEQLIGDHPPIHSKINVESRYVQGSPEEEQEWCQRIVKDARIKPPKDLKKDDKEVKKMKEKKKIEQKQQQKTQKSKPNLSAKDLKKEQERRKQIQAEIDRKKQQILHQYQKRNTNPNKYDPKNKQLREEYEQQLKQQSNQTNKKGAKEKDNGYEPYRQVYKHQASKDPRQINIVGDPLIEEFDYQKGKKRAQQLQVSPANKQIFMSSGKQLMQKKVIKV